MEKGSSKTLLSAKGSFNQFDAVGGGESNLPVQFAALRKAMGSRSDGEDRIATVPPVGYRYMLPSDDRTQEEAKPSRRSITVGSSAVDLLVVDCVVNANHTPLAELPSGRGRSCEGISARFRALRMAGSRPNMDGRLPLAAQWD